ncbi:GNAT family N-acetyltransferase [Nonomuraea sp. NPDC059194]|uniref:GNAT family N-acetyltransferase n=1 Tax=Nonomuraea sp. NPDC059194 TaxID=3346764 RepID=UPI0036AFCF86
MIRTRRPGDLAGCVAALRAVHERDGYPLAWPADPEEWLTPDGLIRAWVAEDDGVIIGHAALRGADPELPEADACLARLFVAPHARGRGDAARLLAAVEREGDGLGLRLGLDVADSGRGAIAFYERAGWRRIASGRAGWLDADGRPALVHHYLR